MKHDEAYHRQCQGASRPTPSLSILGGDGQWMAMGIPKLREASGKSVEIRCAPVACYGMASSGIDSRKNRVQLQEESSRGGFNGCPMIDVALHDPKERTNRTDSTLFSWYLWHMGGINLLWKLLLGSSASPIISM